MKNSSTTSSKPSSEPVRAKSSPVAQASSGSFAHNNDSRQGACHLVASILRARATRSKPRDHGAWRGSLLSLRRISRCRPLGPHGVDLVPKHRTVGVFQ